MTRQEAFDEINEIQDEYIDELITLMNNPAYDSMKMLNFTSPTGTGKTKMMSKLIKRYSKSEYYFIITTLSKGQLHIQIRDNLAKDLVDYDNYYVYGSADFRVNSKLDAETLIGRIPEGSKCIWLRDEGHIRTNKWDEVLLDVCYKVINFSATNTHSDIQCNFTQTMMLRTVNQNHGTPEDAINKLLEVKKAHKSVKGYNPCAIFRCVSGDTELQKMIEDLCKLHGLKYIDITEETYNMQEICEDDNEYDVIINKFKIVEGIDIRRAHVLYMDNQPGNNSTTIQVIGRCRRNALLYRDDIDILNPKNKRLLEATRECYVYYNVENMKIDKDENGELQSAFCNYISCQELKPNTIIDVIDGQLSNGLYIIELERCTGKYTVGIDISTGCNIILPTTDFYKKDIYQYQNYIYISDYTHELYKVNTKWLKSTTLRYKEKIFDYSTGNYKYVNVDSSKEFIYVKDALGDYKQNYFYQLSDNYYITQCKQLYEDYISNLSTLYVSNTELYDSIKHIYIPGTNITISSFNKEWFIDYLTKYISKYKNKNGYKAICKSISSMNLDNILNLITAYMKCYNKNSLWSYWSMEDISISEDSTIAKYLIALWLYSTNNIQYKTSFTKYSDSTRLYYYYLYNYTGDTNTLIKLLCHYINKEDMTDYSIVNSFKTILKREALIYDYSTNHNNKIQEKIICENKEEAILQDSKFVTSLYNLILNGFNIPETIFIYDKARIEPVSLDIKKYVHSYRTTDRFLLKDIQKLTKYTEYTQVVNDYESAIIGTDLMKQIKDNDTGIVKWVESKSVSSKIGNYNKFNSFISTKYKEELLSVKNQLCKGKNEFDLPTKCNSVIGYCVEYYSKYLIYGIDSIQYYIKQACHESKIPYTSSLEITDMLIIRACMLQYRDAMVGCFGPKVARLIKTISLSQIIKAEYKNFVDLVVTLGKQTAQFVKQQLYSNTITDNINPNLSINHITGLADYITEDTILDVKVRGYIGENEVKQVLAYHYLSTKRSDLHIKRVIVYDATSGRHVSIDITPENWKENQPYGYKD